MTHYIVSKRNFEYNDEGFSAEEGGIPVHVASSREEANKWMSDQIISDARQGKIYMLENAYISSEYIHEYIDTFGSKGLDICDYGPSKEGYLEQEPNMTDWTDDKVLKFLECLNLSLYFITEV
jgi:hypothetical protein